MDSFYNTPGLCGDQLKFEVSNATNQEDKILEFFKLNPVLMFTPFDVLHHLFSNSVPITSIRRAITNLTSKGKLVKTRYQRKGDYGKVCFCWKLKQ